METIIDVCLHLNEHLDAWARDLGAWLYAILFLVVFCETGLVVTPFLPGDSLLFAVGALAAGGTLELWVLMPLLWAAGVLGDAVNYAIGCRLGPMVFKRETSFLLNKRHLLRAQAFYEKHGGKTIIIARFVPIIRTFAPFVAGIGRMQYRRFALFNVFGAALWVVLLTLAGYFFGTLPVVKEHFELVILAIIVLSLMPPVIEWLRARRRASLPAPASARDPV